MPTPHTSSASDELIARWIAATDTLDEDRFLSFFTDDAELDDPGVGAVFRGREGLADYFRTYFLGYRTRTRLVRTEVRQGHVHVVVDFTGDFPGGRTGGTFDVVRVGDRLHRVRADLLEA